MVRETLENVVDQHDLFHFGTRLLQLGRYRDALGLLREYSAHHSGSEVLNNLGVAHYQLAAETLAACDGSLVLRYKLPLVVDAETVRGRARLRGSVDSPCYRSPAFESDIDEAIGYFEDATEQSPGHVAAWINLASAYLLDNRASAASAQRTRP